MAATFVARIRKIRNINDDIENNSTQKKNDAVILSLLQNKVNLIND